MKFRVYNGPREDSIGARMSAFERDCSEIEADSIEEAIEEVENRWNTEEGQLLFIFCAEEDEGWPEGRLVQVEKSTTLKNITGWCQTPEEEE